MSIHFITGKPGAGKGLLMMQKIIDELRTGRRCVITNFAVEIDAWVTADFRPQMGLKAYLIKTYGEDFNCRARIFRVTDEQMERFFLYRPIPVVSDEVERSRSTAKWELQCAKYTAYEDKKEKIERITEFETNLFPLSGGVLYAMDEAWKFYSSRHWQRTGDAVQFYNSQNRKFGDDVLIATQHTKQIDPMIYRVAQDFWVCRNRSLLRFGPFRQPDDIHVGIYEDAPTGSMKEPMQKIKFSIDKKGVGQCYDTSAGVGLSGRMAADLGKVKRGISFKWLVVMGVLIPLFVMLVIWKGGHLAQMGFMRKMGKAPIAGTNAPVSHVPSYYAPPPVPKGANDVRKVSEDVLRHVEKDEVPVVVSGLYRVSGVWHVILSDGREYQSGDLALHQISSRSVIVGTNVYFIRSPVLSAKVEPKIASVAQEKPLLVKDNEPIVIDTTRVRVHDLGRLDLGR
jgi:hypothetical protein